MSRMIVVKFNDHNGAVEYGDIVGELITCKECKHYDNGRCILHNRGFDVEDYCSYGERRE